MSNHEIHYGLDDLLNKYEILKRENATLKSRVASIYAEYHTLLEMWGFVESKERLRVMLLPNNDCTQNKESQKQNQVEIQQH